jgi:hypothetical protein
MLTARFYKIMLSLLQGVIARRMMGRGYDEQQSLVACNA